MAPAMAQANMCHNSVHQREVQPAVESSKARPTWASYHATNRRQHDIEALVVPTKMASKVSNGIGDMWDLKTT